MLRATERTRGAGSAGVLRWIEHVGTPAGHGRRRRHRRGSALDRGRRLNGRKWLARRGWRPLGGRRPAHLRLDGLRAGLPAHPAALVFELLIAVLQLFKPPGHLAELRLEALDPDHLFGGGFLGAGRAFRWLAEHAVEQIAAVLRERRR